MKYDLFTAVLDTSAKGHEQVRLFGFNLIESRTELGMFCLQASSMYIAFISEA